MGVNRRRQEQLFDQFCVSPRGERIGNYSQKELGWSPRGGEPTLQRVSEKAEGSHACGGEPLYAATEVTTEAWSPRVWG